MKVLRHLIKYLRSHFPNRASAIDFTLDRAPWELWNSQRYSDEID